MWNEFRDLEMPKGPLRREGQALKYSLNAAKIHPNAFSHCGRFMNITVYFLYKVCFSFTVANKMLLLIKRAPAMKTSFLRLDIKLTTS